MAIATKTLNVTELALVIGALVRRIRATGPAEAHELSWTQKAALRHLSKDGAATTAELARTEAVKPQSMGTAVAGLEEMGLVERRPHPTDGRQIHIQLTTLGTTVWQRTLDAKETWLAEAVGTLDLQDQRTLAAAVQIFKKMADL